MQNRVKIILIFILSFLSILFFSEIAIKYYDSNAKYLENIRSSLLNFEGNDDLESDKNKILLEFLDNNKLDDFAKCLRNSSDRVLCNRFDGGSVLLNPDVSLIDKYLDNYDFAQNSVSTISSGSLLEVGNNHPDLYARDTSITAKREVKSDNSEKPFEEFLDSPDIIYSNFSDDIDKRLNILVLADSFGVGDGLLNTDETWVRELESELNKIDDRFSFTLAAASGAGYNQYLQWIENGLYDKIKPDMVIISFFENDFDFIDSVIKNSNSNALSNLDNKLYYYINCFEQDDTFLTKATSFFSSILPNLYRYFKFTNCGDNYSTYDIDNNVNFDDVFKSYQRLDELIDVPLFFYDLNYDYLSRSNFIKDKLKKNGFKFLNNNDSLPEYISSVCGSKVICEKLTVNKFNLHYNYKFIKKIISTSIKDSYDMLTLSGTKADNKNFNTNSNLIIDFLPRFISIEDRGLKGARVGFMNFNSIKPYLTDGESFSYLRNFHPYLCTNFGRPFQIINLNRHLTNNKSFEVVFEKVNNELYIGTLGYSAEGAHIISDLTKIRSGDIMKFNGSESVRSLILISNDKGCYDNQFELGKTFTEYLFTIKLL